MRWVIFPRTSYLNHLKIEERNPKIGEEFSASGLNPMITLGNKMGPCRYGIASGGISYAYLKEAIQRLGSVDPIRNTATAEVSDTAGIGLPRCGSGR